MDDNDTIDKNVLSTFFTNGVVRTPFGVGIIQGWMKTSKGDHVLAVRVPVDDNNVKYLRASNVIGKYKEGSDTEKRSSSAIWCFYPKSLEAVNEQPRKSRKG